MRLTRVTAVALATTLLVVAPAEAGRTKIYAPPGKAGSSEYVEVVPTGGGNVQTPAMGGGNPTAKQISSLGKGRSGVRKLATLGKQGAAAAQFAQRTAPPLVRSSRGLQGPGTATSSQAPRASSSGGSAFSGITHLLGGSDDGGIGFFLPLLLAFGLGAAVSAALLRRRHSRGAIVPPA